MLFESFHCALDLAGVHIFAGYIRFLNRTPRSYWLSLASAIAIAFVFVHIFPSLGAWQADARNKRATCPRIANVLRGRAGALRFHHLNYLPAFTGAVVATVETTDCTPGEARALLVGKVCK